MYKSIKSIHIKKERMNNMDENIELLEYIYKNAEMGVVVGLVLVLLGYSQVSLLNWG